jgi:hypothetical protein
MKTHELNQQAWKKFFERISESHRGTLLTVHSLESDGTNRPVTQGVPLQSMVLEQQAGTCNDVLVIETGLPNEKPARLRIIEPIYIRLKDGKDGRYNHIHIASEEGTTVIDLHPSLTVEFLAELNGLQRA